MVRYKKNPDLSNRELDTCVSELINWAYHSRLKRTDEIPTQDKFNTKPFIIGSYPSFDRIYPTDIHCYTVDLIKYLNIDSETTKKYSHGVLILFILEYITPILLKYKILSISFGNEVYSLNKKNEYVYCEII